MPETHPLQQSDPRSLGEYRLTGRLGKGAQGIVYKGEAPDGRLVAIKLLNTRLDRPGMDGERFMREVAAARRVAQFCTAQVLDANMDGEHPYIVSELVDGVSLQLVVQREGPREGGALYRLAVGTVTALAAIHRAGIVHRDLKPSNVLLGTDGPRVIDFGIARALDSAVTISSGVVGTPAYMSPEQISGERVGPASDMFSWALTMVYAATGRPAFGQDSLPAVIYRVMNDEPDLTALPETLRGIVRSCLRKRPEERPTAAETLFALLENQGEAKPRGDHEGALTTGSQLASDREDAPADGPDPASHHQGAPTAGSRHASGSESVAEHTPTPDAPAPSPGASAAWPGAPAGAPLPSPVGPLPAPAPGSGPVPGSGGPGFAPPGGPVSPGGAPVGAPGAVPPPSGPAVSPTGWANPSGGPYPPAPPPGWPYDARPPHPGNPPAPHPGISPAPHPGNPPAPSHGPQPSNRSPQPSGQPVGQHGGQPVEQHGGQVGGQEPVTRQVREEPRRPLPPPYPLGAAPEEQPRGGGVDNDAFFRHVPPDAPPAGAGSRRGRAVMVSAALVVALALAGGVLLYAPRMFAGDRGATVAAATTSVTPTPTTTPTIAPTPTATPTPTPTPSDTPTQVAQVTVPVLGEQDGKSLKGHTKAVQTFSALTSGGRTWLVSGGQDGRLRVWDPVRHKALATLKGHSEEVYAVACVMVGGTPMAVSGGYDGSVRLWNLKTHKGKVLGWHDDAVYAVAVTKVGGRYVAVTGDARGWLRFWDLKKRKATGTTVRAHRRSVNWLGVGRVGGRAVAVSASEDETLRVWDVARHKAYGKAYKGHTKGVYAVAVGAVDGRAVVASGGKDMRIRLWDPKTGKSIGSPMKGHKKIIYSLAFGTVDGRPVLLSGGTDGTIRLWDPRTRKPLGKSVKAHKSGVYAVAVLELDGRQVAVSAGKDKAIRMWDLDAVAGTS
ncbi:protein kinase [Nonomuraea pusilla]|uniref:protein kinase domain-containing protein n=1 Tax=Nonomuraea pusilla TaxID=46177 RepID=UPI0033167F06